MAIGEHFTGSALGVVDAKSRASLPAPFRVAVERRSEIAVKAGAPALERIIYLDEHPDMPCVRGFDPVFQDTYAQEVRDDASGKAGADRLSVIARANSDLFGDASEVGYDPSGRFVLPGSLRKYAGIDLGGAALFRGAGGIFEIWNPDRYRTAYHDDAKRMRKLDDLLEARAARA